jgi:exonuclease SbcC
MRLHRLRATAFGPFAGTVDVDVDALADAGLFLLTGPTGAGKSSVLDAVCFALYGAVPGARGTARRLRSDHAEAGVRPEVELEVSLAGRRLRIVRSPAWERPKKRGTGTTAEPARVVLSERVAGTWRPLSTRVDEAGHLLADLLGMTLTQFTQVALLPQGRFQAFLQAGADDRQALLERLFRTARFRDVENWLADRRRELGRASREHEHRLGVLLSRVGEVTGDEPPAAWAEQGLTATVGEVLPWLDQRETRARERADRAASRRRESARVAAGTGEALRAAEELAQRREQHARAVAELAAVAAEAGVWREHQERLDAAHRAAPVEPALQLLDAAAGTLDDAGRTLDGLEEALTRAAWPRGAGAAPADPVVGPTASDGPAVGPPAGRDPVAGLLADLRAARPARERLAELAARQAERTDRREVAGTAVASLDAELAALPERLRGARAEHDRARAAVAAVDAARETADRATVRLAAARRLPPLEARLAEAMATRQQAVDHLHHGRETWLAVREERLAGMAAEIAGQLAAGTDCPVCGSADHPRPAVSYAGAPDAAAERRARRAVDDAEAGRVAADELVRGLETELALARQEADGACPEEQAAHVERLRAEAEEVAATASAVGAAAAAVAELDRLREELLGRRSARQAEIETLDGEDRAAREERDRLEATLAGLRERAGASPDEPWAEVDAGLAGLLELCDRATDARREHRRAALAVESAHERAVAALADAGFDEPGDARAASLPAERRRALEARLREHHDRVAAARSRVDDPVLREAASAPEPDLPALRAAHAEATEAAAAADREGAARERAVARLSELATEVRRAVAAWGPTRRDHERVAALASFAEGRSADNVWQMRLSAYVLSFRLGQVVEAANERLATMSGERYELEHSGRREAGDRRGGLGLLVRDAWSGLARDPATLSGGETFVVSLALALGLADVITEESAGARLDTLFVDEGFGSLDAETLDDVMDTLDTLRSGGRVVGVVSHVPEMRDRIPAQLRVHKTRAGSTTELAGVG